MRCFETQHEALMAHKSMKHYEYQFASYIQIAYVCLQNAKSPVGYTNSAFHDAEQTINYIRYPYTKVYLSDVKGA